MIRQVSGFFRDERGMQTLEIVMLFSIAVVIAVGVIGIVRIVIANAKAFIGVAIRS